MKYSNKPIYERIAASPLALIAALVVLGFLTRAAWNIHAKASTSSQKLALEQTQLAKLQANQDTLSAKVAYLSTDQGVEAEMRTKFKAVKDGEQVAVIVDDKSQTAAAVEATSTPSSPPAGGWWGRVLRFFGL